MGVILGSAVVPIALCITWSRANKWGCIGGSIAGFFAGLIAWLVTTNALNGGVINVTTSGGDYEMLAGNLASIGVGGIISVVASLIVSNVYFSCDCDCAEFTLTQWPEDFDFESTRALNVKAPVPIVTSGVEYSDEKTAEKGSEKEHDFTEARSAVDDEGPNIASDADLDPVSLDRAFRFAAWSSAALVCDLSPLWYRF
jgi:urea-proton symporter